MTEINRELFLRNLSAILGETFNSSGDRPFSIYLDGKIGVFNTLESVTAEQASREINGNTIAAHAEHIRFYLEFTQRFMEGSTETVDWAQSWRMKTVSDAEWTDFQAKLRREYQELKTYLKSIEDWDDERIGGAIAIVSHTAYHFGAIRQMLKAI